MDEFLAHMLNLIERLAHTVIRGDHLTRMMILLALMTTHIEHMTILNQLLRYMIIPGVRLSQPVAHGLQF